MPKLDYILFCEETQTDPTTKEVSILRPRHRMQRLAEDWEGRGMSGISGYWRISGCKELDTVAIRFAVFNSRGERWTDPHMPGMETLTDDLGHAYGTIKFPFLAYDSIGLRFEAECDGETVGDWWLKTSQLPDGPEPPPRPGQDDFLSDT